jgi:hypothetical protein
MSALWQPPPPRSIISHLVSSDGSTHVSCLQLHTCMSESLMHMHSVWPLHPPSVIGVSSCHAVMSCICNHATLCMATEPDCHIFNGCIIGVPSCPAGGVGVYLHPQPDQLYARGNLHQQGSLQRKFGHSNCNQVLRRDQKQVEVADRAECVMRCGVLWCGLVSPHDDNLSCAQHMKPLTSCMHRVTCTNKGLCNVSVGRCTCPPMPQPCLMGLAVAHPPPPQNPPPPPPLTHTLTMHATPPPHTHTPCPLPPPPHTHPVPCPPPPQVGSRLSK